MKAIKILVLVTLLTALSCKTSFSGKEEALPKIGFAKNDGSNIRAGGNINYEALCKLKKGDPVKIIDKRYSWFKILLPKNAYLYIKNDYADIASDGIGEVNAERVNLRAGPGTKYSILGQVSRPQRLNVVSEKDGWFKIEPPTETAGWIHASQLRFDLELVKPVETEEIVKPPVEIEKEEQSKLSAVKKTSSKSIILERRIPIPKGNLTFSTQNR